MPELPDLDLALLRSLDVLLEEAHVTRAARRLGVTQSAMSHRLRQLRAIFDDPLLVSSPTGLVPTPRAESVAGPLRVALRDLGAALRAADPFDPGTTARRFVLGMTDYVMAASLPRFLQPIRDEAPGATFVLETVGPDAGDRLAEGTVDLAFTARAVEAAGVRRKRVYTEGFLVIARRDHPVLGNAETIDLETFTERLDHLLVAPGGGARGIVDAALAPRGLARRVALRIPSFVPAPFLVAHSDLVCTIPLGMAAATAELLGLRCYPTPLPVPSVDAYLYWHERAENDPGHRWLRDRVIGVVEASADALTRATSGGGSRAPRLP